MSKDYCGCVVSASPIQEDGRDKMVSLHELARFVDQTPTHHNVFFVGVLGFCRLVQAKFVSGCLKVLHTSVHLAAVSPIHSNPSTVAFCLTRHPRPTFWDKNIKWNPQEARIYTHSVFWGDAPTPPKIPHLRWGAPASLTLPTF